jgi:hypothetical protein
MKAVQSWLRSAAAPPRMLRRCQACGEETWRPIDRAIRGARRVLANARLAGGRRADLALLDAQGQPRLIVQLEGGSRLQDRADGVTGVPLVVLGGAAVVADPLAWRPLREQNLRPWRCRCALARTLPVDDGFSLRVIGCPINVRREETGSYALVIQDCGRCAFFVGIGYATGERRRVSLYCAYDSPLHDRRGPSAAAAQGIVLGAVPAGIRAAS